VDAPDPGEVDMVVSGSMPRRVIVPPYMKQNCKDNVLDPVSDFVRFLLSLTQKANVGVHIDRYNSSGLDILDLVGSPSLEIII